MPNRKPCNSPPAQPSRRDFLRTAAIAAIAAPLTTTILGADDKSGSRNPILGTGAYQYEAIHNWGQLPAHVTWGETHGVAVDREGLVYVKHRSTAPQPMDAIVVFDDQGRFVRSFGKEYHGGGHGIDIRLEGSEEFLYLSDVTNNVVVKATLSGEQVWRKGRPAEAGVYEDPQVKYSPTNVAFAPDGGFYIGDGYGSHYIHQYDQNAAWVRTWGGFGDAAGQMKTPHGLWLDTRPGREPALVVADRANARLQYFTLDGQHLSFVGDVSFPADIDIQGDVLLCSDLHARVTLLDKNNQVISHLGYDADWTKEVLADGFTMRREPQRWQAGRFIHPHDACFDQQGNIFVTEWVPTGRVTLLKKV